MRRYVFVTINFYKIFLEAYFDDVLDRAEGIIRRISQLMRMKAEKAFVKDQGLSYEEYALERQLTQYFVSDALFPVLKLLESPLAVKQPFSREEFRQRLYKYRLEVEEQLDTRLVYIAGFGIC